MLITKTSIFSGKTRTLDLDITQEELDSWHKKEKLIQDAFPRLNVDEREFLLTGAWDGEFEDGLGPENEEDIEDEKEPAF